MKKRKPMIDEASCPPGSPEQMTDMCERGSLRGDEQLREYKSHPLFEEDLAEEDREGDEMSGDEHSAGLQGGDPEFWDQDQEYGLPGDVTRLEDLRARRRNLPEEPEPVGEFGHIPETRQKRFRKKTRRTR